MRLAGRVLLLTALWIATDARSDKNAHLHERPDAEMALYLPALRRQFRLAGVMPRMEDPAMRSACWSQLPQATQAMFFWPQPGARRTLGAEAFAAAPPAAGIPDTFEPLVLFPLQVDFLDLAAAPHVRRRWWAEGDGQWRGEPHG